MAAIAPMPLSRLDELLADRAAVGLSPDESAELDRLLAESPDADDSSWDRAAAAAFVALVGREAEALPDTVRTRVETAARPKLLQQPRPRTTPPPPRRRALGGREALAWVVAAAALAFALLPAARPDRSSGPELRERLAAEADTLELPWTTTEDPAAAGAGGRVLWNGGLQQGVMVFRGLAVNDPAQSQYQLWIFDATRDEAHPVDGGVFDVRSGSGEVVVPIRATLPVREATLFAITIERPGGVVVSSRERLPLLAKAGR